MSENFKEIGPKRVKGWMDNEPDSIFLLDVREPHEHAHASVDGFALISLGDVAARAAEVPKDKRVVVMCRSGMRSQKACNILADAGHEHLYNLTGGILAWSDLIDPSIQKY